MSETTTPTTRSAAVVSRNVQRTTALVSEQGRTSIADTVVSKIAGIATREISGVHDLGGGAARAVGASASGSPAPAPTSARASRSRSASARPPSTSTSSPSTAWRSPTWPTAIRRNVVGSVERMTGLEVTEVNITVHDIFMDTDGRRHRRREHRPRVE